MANWEAPARFGITRLEQALTAKGLDGRASRRRPGPPRHSHAILAGAQILVEERQDMVLKTVGYGAGVGAGINLEGVGHAVTVENLVQLARAGSQAILVAHIDRDCAVPAQITD